MLILLSSHATGFVLELERVCWAASSMKRAMATTGGPPGVEESQGKGPNDEGSRKKAGADKSDKTVNLRTP